MGVFRPRSLDRAFHTDGRTVKAIADVFCLTKGPAALVIKRNLMLGDATFPGVTKRGPEWFDLRVQERKRGETVARAMKKNSAF